MFTLKEWSSDLDLSSFYNKASQLGFVNNASEKAMIDCFRNEREWNAWILYLNNDPVGSVAAHSFDDVMGPNSYRILTRVCTFSSARPSKGLTTARRLCAEHQNLTDQFLLPQCITWAGRENRLYATSNNSKEASQRLVHNIYFPTLEKTGVVSKTKEVYYRGLTQTVWQIHPEEFEESLNKWPRW